MEELKRYVKNTKIHTHLRSTIEGPSNQKDIWTLAVTRNKLN